MPDQRYPTDAIGNEIRRGDLLTIRLNEPSLIVRVAQVDAASALNDGNGKPLPTTGTLVLTAVIPIQFAYDAPTIPTVLVLKTPEEARVVAPPSGLQVVKQ